MRIIQILIFFVYTLSAYCMPKDTVPSCIQQADIANRLSAKYNYLQENAVSASEQRIFWDVITVNAGQLAERLGADINNIDSLIIHGPINDKDFYTLWSASFHGRLTVLNLENADIENDIIPRNAFWRQREQLNFEGGYIKCIHLKRIIFPEKLKSIGEMAFSYAIDLVEINIPSGLCYIDTYAFSDCIRLVTDPLTFPEGFERLGSLVFMNCHKLTGQVILPSTIKEIGAGAFFQSKISSVNFPDGLEKIDDAAFYACRLKEIFIPNSCQNLDGSTHFQLNYTLERASLPEGIVRIPNGFFDSCMELKEVNIPSTVKLIDRYAFNQCISLKKLDLPAGLESIEAVGLSTCNSLEQIVFPASMKTLGGRSCKGWDEIKRIYCMALEPPVCEGYSDSGDTPFGSYNSDPQSGTPNNVPVYIPIGTAEKYRNAWGWDYFTNFIETDDFPTGIQDVTENAEDSYMSIFDLVGRKVTNPQKGQVYIINGKKMVY